MRKYKINKKDRKAWLDALESGEYEQCKSALYDANKYCCLGVFGAVKGIDNDVLGKYAMPNELFKEDAKLYPQCLLTPYQSQSKRFSSILADMNDEGKSFKQIAKYIRKHTIGV